MKPFKTHTGVVAILDRENIDTDQIISKEFLKSIHRTGFGPQLFHHWKYLKDGSPNPDFELNDPAFQNASILITGNNFGCGSSREHAVWAVHQYGFQVVIAPSKKSNDELIPGFADIFRNNSSKNGLLLIEWDASTVQKLKESVSKNKGVKATVDLAKQTLTLHTSSPLEISFDIDGGLKRKFLEGLDDIGQSERFLNQIVEFERKHETYLHA